MKRLKGDSSVRSRILVVLLMTLFGAGLVGPKVMAAEFSPALQYELDKAQGANLVSAIVILESPIDIRVLDQRLHVEKATKARRHTEVLAALHYNADQTQPKVRAEFDQAVADGVMKGYTPYWIENLFVIQATKDFIEGLRGRGDIKYVTENFQAELIEPVNVQEGRGSGNPLDTRTLAPGIREVGALRVNEELGITGNGVLIGDCDTGTDGNHPALAARWRGLSAPWWQCWKDNVNLSSQFPADAAQHGTHTMGTMTGRAVSGTDTTWVGCAPSAHWISNNAISMNVGRTLDNEVINSYQWFADPDTISHSLAAVPDVINNSWGVFANIGGDPTYTQCFDFWNAVILNCEAGGTVICFAAGNEGPGASSLRSPAIYSINDWQFFAVGAVDGTTNQTPPYPIASFSSRGPTPCVPANPNNIKPEISAPGVNVLSSIPGGTYQDTWSGTSMATPHVSGTVALMREACPDCDPQTIKEAIMSTAIRTGYVTPPATENNTFGNGFIDAYAAVIQVYALGRVDGHVATSAGTPVPGVLVKALVSTDSTFTDSSGYYLLRTRQAGWYNIQYSKFGFQTITHDSVQTIQGDTTHVDITMNAVPGGTLAAHVMVQSGAPALGARVTFVGTPLDPIIVDSTGRFVQALPATNYTVHIAYVINLVPPRGYTLDTTVTVTANDTTRVTFPIFVDIIEPSNADAYGYRVYDRYDRDLPCPFNWMGLDSAQNSGVAFGFGHQDSSIYFRAPFPISFYGQLSDTMTVNCNGWMLPGVHHNAGKFNSRIPYPPDSAGDPPGIIAPFWADMNNTGPLAAQYVGNDSINGRWIIELYHQHLLWPASYAQTWEVQFRDPAYYPTATGDAEILFLYGAMGWLSNCTMGLENPARTTGIQVRYDTTTSVWSWPVQNGGAMRWTTGLATQRGSVTVNLSLYPPATTGTPLVIHTGGRIISSTYGSTLTADSVPAAPVSSVLRMTGYEAGRSDRVTVAPNQNTTVPLVAWRLDPPQNVSGTQRNGVVTLHWNTPVSVQYHANPAIRYDVYRDGYPLAWTLTDTILDDEALPNDSTVHYTVIADYRYGSASTSPYTVTIDLAAKQPETGLPMVFQLYPNYPNPFNPDTRIRLDVPFAGFGRLEVFDLEGRLVKTLFSGTLSAGRYQYNWGGVDAHGMGVASGLYFCRFSSAAYTATQKMMLIK